MRELPILFNQDMVRAILDGRKTQTRRPIVPQPAWEVGKNLHFKIVNNLMRAFIGDRICATPYYKIPYQAGDMLYVRERARLMHTKPTYCFQFEADGHLWDRQELPKRIKPIKVGHCCPNGCFKELARIWLKVTYVRVERVQDIDELDALAEGFLGEKRHGTMKEAGKPPRTGEFYEGQARDEFIKTWNLCYRNRGYGTSWDSNPWVWVFEFERIDK